MGWRAKPSPSAVVGKKKARGNPAPEDDRAFARAISLGAAIEEYVTARLDRDEEAIRKARAVLLQALTDALG